MPNPNTLSWYHYQDIQIPDVSLRNQFKQLWNVGNYTSALNLLQLNSNGQLWGKAFDANVLNTLTANAATLENQFNTAVPLFLSNLTADFDTIIGSIISMGEWNDTTQYVPYNFVEYQTLYYMCIALPPIGTLPTDTQYWLEFDLHGNPGVPGIDATMRYEWSSSAVYQERDLVVYGSNIYIALQNNSNIQPGTNSSIWGIFITTSPGQIYLGTTAPSDPIQNTVWFQTDVDPLTQTSTTPIIGQFYRYNTSIGDWEEMMPGLLFKEFADYDQYAPVAQYINRTITTSQWSDENKVTLTLPLVTDNSVVTIYPGEDMNSNELYAYSQLRIDFDSNNNMIVSSDSRPLSDVNLHIQIQ